MEREQVLEEHVKHLQKQLEKMHESKRRMETLIISLYQELRSYQDEDDRQTSQNEVDKILPPGGVL